MVKRKQCVGSVKNLVFSTKDKPDIDGGDSPCPPGTPPALYDDVRITLSGFFVIWGMS
jgi:hypothetical protein